MIDPEGGELDLPDAAAAVLHRQPYWSDRMIEEVARNLMLDGRSDTARSACLASTLRRVFPDAEVVGRVDLIARMTNAAEDRHVLATAVVVGADVIVTARVRDFSTESLEPLGIEAMTPDAFLGRLLDAAPHVMRELLVAQATDRSNPPMTFADVLAELALHAPRFAQKVATGLAF